MIKVHAVRIDTGQEIPGSLETFADMRAVGEALAGTATDDYAERVINGLTSDSGITLPNGPNSLDVWAFA